MRREIHWGYLISRILGIAAVLFLVFVFVYSAIVE
jgi:hypothetical protein